VGSGKVKEEAGRLLQLMAAVIGATDDVSDYARSDGVAFLAEGEASPNARNMWSPTTKAGRPRDQAEHPSFRVLGELADIDLEDPDLENGGLEERTVYYVEDPGEGGPDELGLAVLAKMIELESFCIIAGEAKEINGWKSDPVLKMEDRLAHIALPVVTVAELAALTKQMVEERGYELKLNGEIAMDQSVMEIIVKQTYNEKDLKSHGRNLSGTMILKKIDLNFYFERSP
jgi:hypothetical protein